MLRRAGLTAFCTLIGACAVGPDYVKPQVETPDAFRFAQSDVADTANTDWWEQFDDPVLNALIAEALAHNRSVKIAAANVEAAAALLTQAQSQFFPQINYNVAANHQRASESLNPALGKALKNPAESYTTLAGASWEIDLWGRIRRESEAAQANLLASEQVRRGVILSLVAQVASGYLQLRALDRQLEVSERTLKAYGETLRLFELQHKYGVVSQMTVEQARSSYETAAAQIPQIVTQVAQAENGLSILVGANPRAIARGKALEELALPQVPAGLPSQLLERRPDVAQAEQGLIAANAQIGAAKALYFPTISLTGTYGNQSSALDELFSAPTRVWSAAAGVAGPIFAGGAIHAQVRGAEAAKEAALLQYEAVVQGAFADVDNALVARQELVKQVESQERLVKSLSEYERLATLQYKGGYTPYSTVLQAQQSLFPQELTLATSRFALLNSLVDLYKVTGGGWIDVADRMTGPTESP